MSHQTAVKGVRMWLQESRQAESALAPHPGPYTAFLTPRTRRSAANRSTEDTDESDALVPKSPLGVFSALSPALGTAMRAAQGRVSGESRAFEIHAADVTPLAAETAFLASDAALSTPGTPFATPSAAPPPTAATRAPFPPATVFASPSSAVEGSARAAWGRGTEERRGETDAGAQRRLDEDFLGVEEEEEEEGGRGGEGGAGPVAESVGDMVRILSGDTDSGGMSLHRT